MRVLLDECLPLDFRHDLRGHDARTAQWAGFKGKKNGELLQAAEAAGYEVLLTVDQGITHQVQLSGRAIAEIVLHSRTNQIQDLRPLVGAVLKALRSLQPGQVIAVGLPA